MIRFFLNNIHSIGASICINLPAKFWGIFIINIYSSPNRHVAFDYNLTEIGPFFFIEAFCFSFHDPLAQCWASIWLVTSDLETSKSNAISLTMQFFAQAVLQMEISKFVFIWIKDFDRESAPLLCRLELLRN